MLTITCTYVNRTVLPHVEKIVRKGLGSKRSVRLGHVMRRSTLRFPSDFRISFSASIDFKISFRLQDFLHSGSPLIFETVLCANPDVKDILRSPRPP